VLPEIIRLFLQTLCIEATLQHPANVPGPLMLWKQFREPHQRPVPVHRGVPVEMPEEDRMNSAGWLQVLIRPENMSREIGVFPLQPGEDQIQEPLHLTVVENLIPRFQHGQI